MPDTRGFLAMLLLMLLPAIACAGSARPVATVEDAIAMNRIVYAAALDGTVAAISPDGRKAAVVTWRGDLPRNTNVYTVWLVDLEAVSAPPHPVVSRDYVGDPEEQTASAFSQLQFLADGRTLAYIGRADDGSAQAYTVDTQTLQVRQLTDHPTPVRAFAVTADGDLRAYAAVTSADTGEVRARIDGDGVFLWERNLFPTTFKFSSAMPFLLKGASLVRQYFRAAENGPQLFFDSRQSRPAAAPDMTDPAVANSPVQGLHDESVLSGMSTLTLAPDGRTALLFPYGLTEHDMHPERYAYFDSPRVKGNAFVRRAAAPYGLVDLATGRIERLIDAPHPQFEHEETGAPLWSADGRSAILYTLQPQAPAEPPQWMEVEIATRQMTPLGLAKGWKPIAWADAGQTLVLSGPDGQFGTVARTTARRWSPSQARGSTQGFNSAWSVSTNGRVVLGVKDALLTAPELAAYDLATGQSRVLSDFNPQLRERRYGATEPFRWKHRYDENANGFLIKPVDYRPGVRYPLVILLDDGTLRREGEPFLLDGAWQLSGHATQMLAAQGFMVLYPREPPLRGVMGTPEEGQRMRAHIESAIDSLDAQGLIDRRRVGISGWSRAGYHTDYLLIHAPELFAAASAIDGGGSEYTAGMRPFTDDELLRIRTPKLFEPHGLGPLVLMTQMADRMRALGKPTEILYFHTASHSTTRPQHRLRSLDTHIDWWRFWLKDQEDADPGKAMQYTQWRELRALRDRNFSQAR